MVYHVMLLDSLIFYIVLGVHSCAQQNKTIRTNEHDKICNNTMKQFCALFFCFFFFCYRSCCIAYGMKADTHYLACWHFGLTPSNWNKNDVVKLCMPCVAVALY